MRFFPRKRLILFYINLWYNAKMKNNTLIWLLAILAVLIVVTVVQYKYLHKEAIAPVVTKTSTSTVSVATSTSTTSTSTISGSKTYINTVAGFEFEYPAI